MHKYDWSVGNTAHLGSEILDNQIFRVKQQQCKHIWLQLCMNCGFIVGFIGFMLINQCTPSGLKTILLYTCRVILL